MTEPLDELRERCDRLERVVFMLARAILAHEYAKDLHRAGPLEAFEALANDEDLDKYDQARRDFEQARRDGF